MKHMKKVLIGALAVMALSASVLVGCGSSATPASPASLEGTTWKAVSYEITEDDSGGYLAKDAQEVLDNGTSVTFDSEKIYIKNGSYTNDIDYQYADGALTVKETDETTVNGNVNGNTLTIEDGGMKITFEKQ